MHEAAAATFCVYSAYKLTIGLTPPARVEHSTREWIALMTERMLISLIATTAFWGLGTSDANQPGPSASSLRTCLFVLSFPAMRMFFSANTRPLRVAGDMLK